MDRLALVITFAAGHPVGSWLVAGLSGRLGPGDGDLGLWFGDREATGPGSGTESVGTLATDRLPQTALSAVDSLLELELFRLAELFLPCLCLAEELQSQLVLLIVEIVQAVAKQVARPSRGGHADDRVGDGSSTWCVRDCGRSALRGCRYGGGCGPRSGRTVTL
ncbi:MAG TPA: hypothetical protein VJY33_07860, partial [Isosphaeraceae bacterium]|nr:hypothetical protein [Isosphaeraceae bacterium]